MGKWATYRHRGKQSAITAQLGPPAAPTLLANGPDLVATPTSPGNVGGSLWAYYSPDPGGPWNQMVNLPRAEPTVFPAVGPGWWVVIEVGNGVDYTGASGMSNAVEVLE